MCGWWRPPLVRPLAVSHLPRKLPHLHHPLYPHTCPHSCHPRACRGHVRIIEYTHTRTHNTYTRTYTPRTHTHTHTDTIINQSVRFDFVQATSLNFPIRYLINEAKRASLVKSCLAPSNGSVRSISSKFLYHGMFGIEKGRGRY